jgi:ubiquinone/menaquinone biosynthesis C-methylase UbiE/RimJ/RimL family protein N-acetyltransferase
VHPKIRIRRLRGEEPQRILEWVADPAFRGDFLPLTKTSRRGAAKELRKMVSSGDPQFLGIEKTSSHALVGLTLCHRPSGFDYFEVGFYLEPSERGKGYGPAALGLLVGRLFRRNGFETILAGTSSLNVASQRALERAGFGKAGLWEKTLFRNGKWEDSVIYVLYRHEWLLAEPARARSTRSSSFVKEEHTPAYWDRKWSLRKQHLRENVSLDGSDGEREFDQQLQERVRGKDVLDVGCGPGEFTLHVARRANSVVGIDTSSTALELARGSLPKPGATNVLFRHADIRRLPFPDGSFDVVYSRRGPASADKHSLSEALRVLRPGGIFMEITIGERDKQNLAEIFGRGQMLGFRGQVSDVKRRWLREVGFREARSRDYVATEVFRSMDDLLARLRSAPIIPSFDPAKDRLSLERVNAECTTDRGVETPVHRVLLSARKSNPRRRGAGVTRLKSV